MPVKILSLEEPRSMDNGTMICEGLVGDETGTVIMSFWNDECEAVENGLTIDLKDARANLVRGHMRISLGKHGSCLLYTSPSPRDRSLSRMPSSA